jgi:hypothetical protein
MDDLDLHDKPIFRAPCTNAEDREAVMQPDPAQLVPKEFNFTVVGISKSVHGEMVMRLYRSFETPELAKKYLQEELHPYWDRAKILPPQQVYIVPNGTWCVWPPPQTSSETESQETKILRVLDSLYKQHMAPMAEIYDRVANNDDDKLIDKLEARLTPREIDMIENFRKNKTC